MRFDIITIFPNIFDSYFNESILGRAQKSGKIKIQAHDIRDYAKGKNKKVDDTPYGGGPGMVMRANVIARAVDKLISLKVTKPKPKNLKTKAKRNLKTRIILFSPAGKKFTQKDAERYVKKYERLILICGRYEGIDERVSKYLADEIVSVGDYVLSGGEVPAMIVTDAVSRLVPGVLGKGESEESKRLGVGVPVYTRPEVLEIDGKKLSVPKVLLSGDHKEIAAWREANRRASPNNNKDK